MPKQFHSCSVKELPTETYRKLYSLNFRNAGSMRTVLKAARHQHNKIEDANVSYIEDDGKILAWSLEFKPTDNPSYIQHLYTRVNHRKKGMGSELAIAARRKYRLLAGHVDTDIFHRVGTNSIGFHPYGRYEHR